MSWKEALQQEQYDLKKRDETEARLVAEKVSEVVSILARTEFPKTPQEVSDFLLTGWPMNPLLLHPVSALELNTKTQNGLKWAHIRYIGDLVQRTDEQLLKIPWFGPMYIKNIRSILAKIHLSLGMKVENWPPVNLPYGEHLA